MANEIQAKFNDVWRDDRTSIPRGQVREAGQIVQTEVDAARRAPPGSVDSPGLRPELFSNQRTGLAADMPIATFGVVWQSSSRGKFWLIRGEDIEDGVGYRDLVSRVDAYIRPDRTYLVYARVLRVEDPPSPQDIELRWQELNGIGAAVDNVRLKDPIQPAVIDGLEDIVAFVGRQGAPEPDGGLDHVIPVGAVYGRPLVRVYSNGQQTAVLLLGVKDVTDDIAGGADSTALYSAIAAEASARIAGDAPIPALVDKTAHITVAEPSLYSGAIWSYRFTSADGGVTFAGFASDDGMFGVDRLGLYADEVDLFAGAAARINFGTEGGLNLFGVGDGGDLRLFYGLGLYAHPKEDLFAGQLWRAGITAENGMDVIRWDDEGRTDFEPHPDLIGKLGGTTFISPDDLGQPDSVAAGPGTQYSDGSIVFPVAEGPSTIYVRKVTGGPATGFITTNGPVDYAHSGGQSTIAADHDENTQITEPLFPHSAIGFANRLTYQGNALLTGASLTAVAPVADAAGAVGNYYGTLAAFAEEQFEIDAGVKRPGRFIFTSWYGGQPLSEFEAGSNCFVNGVTVAQRAKLRISALFGRSVRCTVTDFCQGESGLLDGPDEAAYDREDYGAAFIEFADDTRNALKTALDQPNLPTLTFFQINQSSGGLAPSPGINDIRLAQLDIHEARGASGITCIGPMYQCSISVLGENIHQSFIGKVMQAEIGGWVRHRIKRGLWTGPLRPTSLVRTGAQIDIGFAVPAGGLEWDDDWIDQTSLIGKGFQVYTLGGVALTVISVTIVAGKVRIILAADPGGPVTVTCAINSAPTAGLWSCGRSILMSRTDQPSVFHRLGYAVPPEIRHYAVAFSKVTN